MFSKILIANRGEIACRVIKTASRLGIRTVAVYSDADRHALHVQMADEAIYLGGSAPAESYLDHEKIISAALKTGAEAIHPGYGFLSENAAFSQLCKDHDVAFVGPPHKAIEIMGSKSAAKQAMETAEVPLLPGYHGKEQDTKKLKAAADTVGYPVLLKAVAGGGGKGMRQVHAADEFDDALAAAKREALSSFGNDDMLVEKFLQEPRHVEVQVFCDSHGNGVYLFERDCSVQRRHQKIIEEAPAPGMTEQLRQKMGEAALKAAEAVSYEGAGTVEFLLDSTGEFYFMEMNTRLQVEHPVTEMITGQDLVEWQLRVAYGDSLPLSQSELTISGHSFEARIYAENPDNEFLPAAGKLHFLQQPAEDDQIRLDTGVVQGDEVGVFYDPMIAKLIVKGDDRDSALQKLSAALAGYHIAGVTTNIDFLRRLSAHPEFKAANLTTDFIDRHHKSLFEQTTVNPQETACIAGLYYLLRPGTAKAGAANTASPWDASDSWRMNLAHRHELTISLADQLFTVEAEAIPASGFTMRTGEYTCRIEGQIDCATLSITIDGHQQEISFAPGADSVTLFTDAGTIEARRVAPDLGEDENREDGSGFSAPMNGTIVDILVSAGDVVQAGETILIMEAMKMEHSVNAPTGGRVTDIFFKVGDLVDGGADLVAFEAEEKTDG